MKEIEVKKEKNEFSYCFIITKDEYIQRDFTKLKNIYLYPCRKYLKNIHSKHFY